jgi:hypothetical protein
VNPVYRTIHGDADLPLMPPFRSEGLAIQYFPLQADLGSLRLFCDRYLNFASKHHHAGIPAEVGRFEPILPYVFLMTCAHPRLEVGDGRYGWFSQKEISFGFPVLRLRKQGGQWMYQGWGFLNPFIYIDNFLGLGTGRELNGWPKQAAVFEGWSDKLSRPGEVLRMITLAQSGSAPLKPRVLLEIHQHRAPQPSFTRPVEAWIEAQRSLLGMWASALRTPRPVAMELLQAWTNPASLWHAWRQMFTFRESSIFTLKQFRDVAQPDAVAYQALVRSTMQIDRWNGAGLVGAPAQMLGDLSGGCSVRFHEYDSQPIVDMLGIHADHERVEGGVHVATARPIAPFWMDTNITYPPGEVLCSRTEQSAWQVPGEAISGPPPATPNLYNESLQPAVPCQPGPFALRAATLHVLPLAADRAALVALCQGYYGVGAPPIVPMGGFVYLVVSIGGEEQLSPGGLKWTARAVGFYVPVTRGGQTSLIAPFTFMGDDVAQITGRELHGSNAALAHFTGAWADRATSGDPLLVLRTQGFPVINEGAQARLHTLVTIEKTPAVTAPGPATPFDLAALKNALGPVNRLSFSVVDLKQYRDGSDPRLAAYQALVRRYLEISKVTDSGEITDPLTVRIDDDPTHPVARILGLLPASAVPGAPVVLRPIQPFWVSGDLLIVAGEVLA